jgi:hypothetical protein
MSVSNFKWRVTLQNPLLKLFSADLCLYNNYILVEVREVLLYSAKKKKLTSYCHDSMLWLQESLLNTNRPGRRLQVQRSKGFCASDGH